MKLSSKFFLSFGLCFLFLTTARAQYRFDSWTTENGLPQNSVYDILQTPDGYLWLTTLDGLVRFDGVRFTVFNKANTPGMKSNRFTVLLRSGNGDLWAATDNSGVTRFRNGAATSFTARDGLPYNSVRGISGDAAGNVWILSGDVIMRFDDERFLPVETNGLKVKFNNSQWNTKVFLGVAENVLYRFEGGKLTSRQIAGDILSQLNYRIEESDETVWTGTDDGRVARIEGGATSKTYLPGEFVNGRFNPFPPDPEMNFTYRTGSGEQFKINFDFEFIRSLTADSSGSLKTVAFRVLFEDREGNVWLGTDGQGLFRIRKQLITVYSKADGLVEKNVYPIYQTTDGAIWIGAWRGGLSQFKDGKFTNFLERGGVDSSLPTAFYQDRDGLLWAAFINDFGDNFRVFKDGKFEKPDNPPKLPERASVSVIYQERDKTFWFGTPLGLVRHKDGETVVYTIEDGLGGLDVKAIIERAAGGLWIGSYGGLSYLANGKFTTFTETDGLPSNNIRALYEDADGTLWIGTYDGGLGRFKDGKFTRFTTANGLFDNGVFQILEDERGNFWMSSNRGIHRVRKQDLNDFADGRIKIFNSTAYGKSDGLLNVECNGGSQPAGIKARDGKMWFPTQDGAAVIDPEIIRVNLQPPPVLIESFSVEREPLAFTDEARIAPGRTNFEINYTALSFINSENIRFKYRLENLDENWIDAGTRRTAYYAYLPPGKYTFRVIAANSDNVWNEEGAAIEIVVEPHFYQTWWFLVLACLAVVLATFGIYRRRLAQVKRRQFVQEEFSRRLINAHEIERRRIAAELHDSLGQSLAMIKNSAVFGSSTVKDLDTAKEHLAEISTQSANAIAEVREIAYNLRPYLLDRLGLTKAISSMLNKIADTSALRVVFAVDDIDGLFENESEISIYRIIQESLNNILKHAEAGEVKVSVKKSERTVMIKIEDDGKGFDVNAKNNSDKRDGFGLFGMAERVRMLGGTLAIESELEKGTMIIIKLNSAINAAARTM